VKDNQVMTWFEVTLYSPCKVASQKSLSAHLGVVGVCTVCVTNLEVYADIVASSGSLCNVDDMQNKL